MRILRQKELELPWGVDPINLIIPERTDHQWVLSIDWHQVLDAVRLHGGEVRRPSGYYILDCVKGRLPQLKLLIPSLVICVNSYCHCAEYRQGVLSIRDFECIGYRIVTRSKTGNGRKLDALKAFLPTGAACLRLDDNIKVLQELVDYRRSSNNDVGHFTITVFDVGRSLFQIVYSVSKGYRPW